MATMEQLDIPDALEREIAERLADGEDAVTRIVTMQWFTYEKDGEDLVVGHEMQLAIEQLAGAVLIEYTPSKYPLMVGLGFPRAARAGVRERLALLPSLRASSH
jgi:hypothetical protein